MSSGPMTTCGARGKGAREEAGAWHEVNGGWVGQLWLARSKKIPHAGGARFFGGQKQGWIF